MNEIQTPNCKRYKCYLSVAYKAFVAASLLLIIYYVHSNKYSVTRKILVEELDSAQNNIISSLPEKTSSGEKTVEEVLQQNQEMIAHNNSQLAENVIRNLKSIQKKLNEKNDRLNSLRVKAFNYRKEIVAQLSAELGKKNILSESDEVQEETLKEKSRKVLSRFVQVRKTEDVRSDPKYILKRKFLDLSLLFVKRDYNSISALYEQAGNILNNKTYTEFAGEIKNFEKDFVSVTPNSEIEKLIKKIESKIAN